MRISPKLCANIYNYNKVWRRHKMKLRQFLEIKCERMSHKRRLALMAIIFSALVVTAFILFGNACYRIGLGEAQNSAIKVKHIETIELPTTKADTLKLPATNDD